MRWITIIGITLALNIIWWQEPIFHGDVLAKAQQWQIWPLLGYSFSCSASIAFLIRNRFTHSASYLFLLLSMLVAFNSQIRNRFEIFALLILFAIFLALVPQDILHLKNTLGLLAFSVLAAYAVPVSISFLANNYITQIFINRSWPMLYGFIFFFTPIFIPNAKGRLLSLVTILAFWIASLLTFGFHLNVFLAILLSLPPFLLQFNKPNFIRWEPLLSIICLCLATILLY
ncbi:hypothetical protein [Eupransor demetentiae]|uniref:Uncharacterized protein n=1 Tax=Eupransor demetentiae TaxID=3109584 RepID=A0ABM9N390_9LACO|nr:hypothetical protein R54876_GBNLAHCA_00169 [Lactobacillaceae bacterium LMG 33000]